MRILCFEVSYVGFSYLKWQQHALRGETILAIKALREMKNKDYPEVDDPRRLGLKEALSVVKAYMEKKGVQWK